MSLPSPPAEPANTRDPREIEQAVAAFGLRLAEPPAFIAESVLNENYRVVTDDGLRFLRFIREDRAAERVLIEHKIVRHAADAGIPAPVPATVGEAPFVRVAGRLVQLYPWVEGRHGSATEADAFAMGEMEARVHLALDSMQEEVLPRDWGGTNWDTDAAIAALSRVDDLIRYYPSPGEEQLRIQATIRIQLELLEGGAARRPSDFAGLPARVCHGDYHDRNVLFGPDGAICGVVDWEVAGIIPPVFELLLALSFSGCLERPILDAYLRGYASRCRLTREECELGVEMWWQSRLHSTSIYRQRFIRGIRAVDRFFEEEGALLRRFADAGYRAWLAREMQAALVVDRAPR